jgi:hypothetical protein
MLLNLSTESYPLICGVYAGFAATRFPVSILVVKVIYRAKVKQRLNDWLVDKET